MRYIIEAEAREVMIDGVMVAQMCKDSSELRLRVVII